MKDFDHTLENKELKVMYLKNKTDQRFRANILKIITSISCGKQ